MELNRRDMMKLGGLGVAGAAAGSLLPVGDLIRAQTRARSTLPSCRTRSRTAFRRPPVLRPFDRRRGADGVWTDFYELSERMTNAKLLKGGRTTKMFGYNGHVPGPTIKATRGRRIRLRVRNQLPPRHPSIGQETTTSVHLHGSASKPQFDGYASDITPSGFYKDYHYPNFQPARTLWYHDHGVHHTAQNVFSGLVAQYHLQRQGRAGSASPGRVRRPADRLRRGVRRGRPAALRRRRAQRHLRRRRPRQRPAVAGHEGEAARLPVPDARGLGLAFLALAPGSGLPDAPSSRQTAG